jgi:hypothetical protein
MKTNSFKASRRDYTSGDANRPQIVCRRDDGPRNRGIKSVSTSCAGKQTDVTQIIVTDVIVMQATGNLMDAGTESGRQ